MHRPKKKTEGRLFCVPSTLCRRTVCTSSGWFWVPSRRRRLADACTDRGGVVGPFPAVLYSTTRWGHTCPFAIPRRASLSRRRPIHRGCGARGGPSGPGRGSEIGVRARPESRMRCLHRLTAAPAAGGVQYTSCVGLPPTGLYKSSQRGRAGRLFFERRQQKPLAGARKP